MAEAAVNQARFDYGCPRCGHSFEQFTYRKRRMGKMEAEMSYLLEEKTRKLENAELLIERLKREVRELNFSVALHDRNAALRTAEETNHGTHDRPVETLLLIKELGRMSNKLDALKGSLRNIADNAAHWDTGCGPDASAFGWIHDIAESAIRTAEESSVVDSTHAKQQEDSANTDGDWDILNDIETSLRAKTDGMKRLLESQTLSPELAALGRELVGLAEKSLGEVEE